LITRLLTDPNLVYLLFVASLWFMAIAITVPGTGIAEVLALIGAVGAVLLFTRLPTNWIAVIFIILGTLGILVLPFFFERFRLVAAGGLALQVAGSLFLFTGLSVSLLLIIVVAVGSLMYQHYVLKPAMETHRLKPAMWSDQPIIGEHGYVKSTIDPVGTVYVRGENWTARSDTPLAVGASVVVLAKEGLTLHVAAEKPKNHPEFDPDILENAD